MALPNSIDAATPGGTDSPALGDDQLRALKTFFEDVLGIPDATSITAAAFSISAGGVVTISQSAPVMTSPQITTSITTDSTTFALVNTTATTVNFAGAATTLNIGAATGTCTIANATVAFTGATAFNCTPPATFTGDVAVNGGDITSTATTFNLLNVTVTTGNLFGAGTANTIGATSGYTNIRHTLFINDTANANMTTGITINQGANDDEIASFKSSGDVAHGITTQTETDTFGSIGKVNAASGGLAIYGWNGGSSAIGLLLQGTAVNDDTGKTTSANGYVYVDTYAKSGTTTTTPGANANLMVIRAGGTTRFIFDAEGSGHGDVEWIAFAKHDDLVLIADIEKALISSLTPEQNDRRKYLERTGIIGADSWHFENGKPRAMVNFSRLAMLHHGAILQVGDKVRQYENRILQLEQQLSAIESRAI